MEIYKPNNNTIDYININNPKSWIIDIYNNINTDNKIEIDYFFYKNSNDIKSNCKNEILKHLYDRNIDAIIHNASSARPKEYYIK